MYYIVTTKERLLMAEFNHGIGMRELTDQYLPVPGSNRGFDPYVKWISAAYLDGVKKQKDNQRKQLDKRL